jgi:hypothetical protein
MATKASEQQEALVYLSNHKIHDLVENLMTALLIERPDNPRSFLEKNLQIMRSIKVECSL